MKSFTFLLVLGFVLIVIGSFASAATINVPGDQATIQAAVNAATVGDTIVVAEGTYNEQGIQINKDVTIEGAGASTTIINGNGTARIFLVLANLSLSGFTVQNGSADAGGGIAFTNSPNNFISNCIIKDCTTTSSGGGVICANSSVVTFTNTTIQDNTSVANGGGGLAINNGSTVTLNSCTVSGNTNNDNEFGGGIAIDGSTLTINSSTISNNTTGGDGGGIRAETATVTITSSTISGNTGTNGGGGISVTTTPLTITSSTLTNNTASGGTGGGIRTDTAATITNCLLTNNESVIGSAIYIEENEEANITNCTIASNTSTYETPMTIFFNSTGGGTVRNCIIANNGASYGIYAAVAGSATILNNDIYNNTLGLYAGGEIVYTTAEALNALPYASGNIDSNPLFVSVSDYRLQTGSPCINAATATGAPTTDLDGNTRPQDGGYDIGAYEYVPTLTTTAYLSENCTANGFYEFVTVLNPNSTDATIDMTFYKPDGTTILVSDLSAPATKRATFAINSLADGLTGFGLKVESTNSVGIAVERLLYKTSTIPVGGDAHCAIEFLSPHNSSKRIVSDTLPVAPNAWILATNSIAAADTATTWYLVEGATHSEHQVFLALTNPNTTAANVTFTFIPDDPEAEDIVKTDIVVPATSRLTYNVNTSVSELASYNGFGTKVVSDQAIVVERAMYSNTDLNEADWGHCSVGSTTTAATWYSPEGSIQPNYTTDILLLNPGAANAIATLTFIPEGGTVADNVTKTETIIANSRLTYNVNSNVPELASYDGFATKVVSDQPIAAERVMYGPDTTKTWGHVSIASQTIGTTWNLPEGSIQTGVYDYIVLMNPGSVAATVTLTHMPTNATAENVIKTTTVAAGSRTTYIVNSEASELSSYNGFGTKITSDQSIAVEQSIYGGDAVNDWTWGQSSIGIVE